MPKKNRIEENKKKNEHFIIAFDHFANTVFKCNQKKLAEIMGTESSRISELRNGKNAVNDDMIDSLIRVSIIKGMQIFRHYLTNNSNTMLLSNVTDKEMVEADNRATNPDYDVIQERLEHDDKTNERSIPYIDPASQLNATITAYVQLTNRLSDDIKKKEIEMEDRLAEKDARITELKDTIAAKEEVIKSRDARIKELERKIAEFAMNDLSRLPFPFGAADDAENPNVSPNY